jgi:inosine/xanthosine triphosphate pyrophosphatase family protein
MRVSFATTNPIKVDSVVRVLKDRGIEVEVIKLDVQEIQADTAPEVATFKCFEAYRNLLAPVLVNDFAIHFEALGGFPGAVVKQVTRQIGLEGYFRMLRTSDGYLSHACTLVSVLAYMDPKMEAALEAPKLFERVTPGNISPEAYRLLPRKPKEKELVMDVFVPEGETLSIGQMTPERFDAWRKRPAHEKFYHDLADWLIARAS